MPRKIGRFGRQECREVGVALRDALAEFGREWGLTIAVSGGKFEPGYFRPGLTLSVAPVAGTTIPTSPEASMFMVCASSVGMAPTDLGREFEYMGATYAVCGFKARAQRAPVLARSKANGKLYRFDAAVPLAAWSATGGATIPAGAYR